MSENNLQYNIDVQAQGALDAINQVKSEAGQLGAGIASGFDQGTSAVKNHDSVMQTLKETYIDHRSEIRMQNFAYNEMQHAVGGVALGMMALEGATGNASKEVKSMLEPMKEGLMTFQGLNFALSAVPYGGFIAGAIAAGVAISQMGDNTKMTKEEVDEFTKSLKGATVTELEVAKTSYQKQAQDYKQMADDIMKTAIEVTDKQGTMHKVLTLENQKKYEEDIKLSNQAAENAKLTDKAISDSAMTRFELVRQSEKDDLAAITDKYAKERAEAKKAYDEELTNIQHAKASNEEKYQAELTAKKNVNAQLKSIDQSEADDKQRILDQESAKEKAHQAIIVGLQKETMSALSDADKTRVESTEQNASKRLQIEKDSNIKKLEDEKKL